ncbi:MAG TPA: hypothetical protein VKL19_09500 [Thermoanaerobaculia bacterium]|nr:hypothetical protein [Thermoanaerobaculia bacterium]
MRIHKIPLMATLVALTATAPTYAQKGERFGMIGIARTQDGTPEHRRDSTRRW